MPPDDSVGFYNDAQLTSQSGGRAETGDQLWYRVLARLLRLIERPKPPADEAGLVRVRINLKMLLLAIVLEFVVGGVQWYGGWLMAETYGHGHWIEQQMMMLAPSLYFLAELTRVPLALAFRMHKSGIVRTSALVVALFSAVITVKSASQIGEQMYRGRLHDVRMAKIEVSKAEATDQSLEAQIASSADDMAAMRAQLKATHTSVDDARAKLVQIPPPSCSPLVWYDREGRVHRDRRCIADPRTPALTHALKDAEDRLTPAGEKAQSVTRGWSDLIEQRPAAKAAVADAQARLDRAVMESQIHSFAGMLFRKGPNEVTDAEIYTFLLIFVFAPAVVISLVGFMLTCAAVHRLPPTHITMDRKTSKEITKYLRG